MTTDELINDPRVAIPAVDEPDTRLLTVAMHTRRRSTMPQP